MDKISFIGQNNLYTRPHKLLNKTQNSTIVNNYTNLSFTGQQFIPTKDVLAQFKGIKLQNMISFGQKIGDFTLAMKENDIDKLLNNNTTTIQLDPIKEYEALSDGNKKALKHLVRAAKVFDKVRLEQTHHENLKVQKALETAASTGDKEAQKALKLFTMFYGVEGPNKLGPDPIRLFEGLTLNDGKNFYPDNLKAEQAISYLKTIMDDPKEIEKILSVNTMVRWQDNKLVAIPNTEYFKNEFKEAAKELRAAANATDHEGFREFLILQAGALEENNPQLDYQAEKAWLNLKDSPLEFTISRENYDDALTPAILKDQELNQLVKDNKLKAIPKDSLWARVGIVDVESTKKLMTLKEHINQLAKLMPLYDRYPATGECKQNFSTVNLVYYNQGNRPGMFAAQTLPNDDKEAAKRREGTKNVFHKQFQEKPADKENLQILLDNLVDESQHQLYDQKVGTLHTVGHEISHALGPSEKYAGMGDYGHIIEETKADMGSFTVMKYFVDQGIYKPEELEKMALTHAIKMMPMGKPAISSTYAFSDLIKMNYFIYNGAISFNKDTKLKINDNFFEVAHNLLTDLIELQLNGNLKDVEAFVARYGQWNDFYTDIVDFRKSKQKLKPYVDLDMSMAERLLADKEA